MNNSPYLNRYRNGEYLQYMKDILKLLNLQDKDALKLTNPTNELSTAIAPINAVFQQAKGSDITQEIIALDERRDKAITGIRFTLTGFAYSFDEAIATSAEVIIRNIDLHGANIARKSYQEETAILSSIIEDLETKFELIEAVTILKITDWVAELKNANEAFAAKYIERVGETAANPSADIPELKSTATKAYRSLVNHIQAHATLSDVEAYTILLNEIDVLAKQYNLVVDNRATSTTSSEEEVVENSLNNEESL